MDISVNRKKIISVDDISPENIDKLKEALNDTGKIQCSTDEGNINIEFPVNEVAMRGSLGILKGVLTFVSVAISLAQTGALMSIGRVFNLFEKQNLVTSLLVSILIGYVSQKLAERSVTQSKIKGLIISPSLFTGSLSFLRDFQLSITSGRNSFILNLLYMGYLIARKSAS